MRTKFAQPPIRAIITSLAILQLAANGDVLSTFNADSDGWSVVDIHQPITGVPTLTGTYTPVFVASGGTSGGCIQQYDLSGDAYFFSAPPRFLGNQSGSLHGRLSWSLQCNEATDPSGSVAEQLIMSDGTTTLYYSAEGPGPANTWRPYNVDLNGSSFTVGSRTGVVATDAQLQTVLSNLTSLYILGDWGYDDTSRLDDVRLSTPVLRIVAHPQSQVGYWGKSVSFSVTAADGTPPYTYQWLKDGVEIEGATGSQIELTNLQAENAGSYTVTVKDADNTTLISQAATLVVNPAGVSIATYAGLTIDGVIGQTYGIQATADLGNPGGWVGVANVTLTQPTQIWYDSQSTAQQPRRFYRVVAGPISIP